MRHVTPDQTNNILRNNLYYNAHSPIWICTVRYCLILFLSRLTLMIWLIVWFSHMQAAVNIWTQAAYVQERIKSIKKKNKCRATTKEII